MSGTVTINKLFEKRDDAEAFKSAYEQSYSPFGYGTELTIDPPRTGRNLSDLWRVSGWRGETCN